MGNTVDEAGVGRKISSVLDMLNLGCLLDIQMDMLIRLKSGLY